MTTMHPGFPTNPMRPGAPLEDTLPALPRISLSDVQDELTRAEVELLYACAKHRKAWSRMRKHAEERELLAESGQVGALPTLDADFYWKKKVGDVQWWRDEMTAQATAVLALTQLADLK